MCSRLDTTHGPFEVAVFHSKDSASVPSSPSFFKSRAYNSFQQCEFLPFLCFQSYSCASFPVLTPQSIIGCRGRNVNECQWRRQRGLCQSADDLWPSRPDYEYIEKTTDIIFPDCSAKAKCQLIFWDLQIKFAYRYRYTCTRIRTHYPSLPKRLLL